MFDIGMSELLVIGVVALIVIGPKDLPQLFQTLGRFTAKARALGREFNRAMNDAARESGISDVSNTLKGVSNPKKYGLDTLNEAADRFEKWEPGAPGSPEPAPMATTEATKPVVSAETDAQAEAAPKADAEKTPAKKTTAKKPAAKKTTAKKPAGKAAESKSSSAKTGKAKTQAAEKPAAKKPAAKKPANKSSAAKKPTTKKPASKKAAPKSDTNKADEA